MTVRETTRSDLSLILITLVWGSSFLVVKDALSVMTPLWLLALRFSLASVILLVFFPRIFRSARREVVFSSLVVGVFLYFGFVFQTWGLMFTTPAKSAFITGCSVPLVPLLNLAIFKVRIRPAVAAGNGMAFLGLYLLTRPDDLHSINRGDVLTLICAVAFALQIIFIGRYAPRVPYRQLAVFQVFWACLFSVPAALLVGVPRLDYTISIYMSVIYLALFCSAIAFLVQSYAQQHTSAARAALIFSLEPVFAAAASMTFFGERLTGAEWVGGTLIVLGVMAGEVPVLEFIKERAKKLYV